MPERIPERRPAPLGVFGGTFDPPHVGHLRLAEEAADGLRLAAVRWIPAGRPALRRTPRASAAQRLAMVRLAVADNPRFEVDGAEVESDSPSYTVPTLERLVAAEDAGARRSLVLILGADAFGGLPAWHRWRELFDLAHIAVAHRPGSPLELGHLAPPLAEACSGRLVNDPAALAGCRAGFVTRLETTALDVSATGVRTRLAAGASVRYLLTDAVLDHVRRERLYLEEETR